MRVVRSVKNEQFDDRKEESRLKARKIYNISPTLVVTGKSRNALKRLIRSGKNQSPNTAKKDPVTSTQDLVDAMKKFYKFYLLNISCQKSGGEQMSDVVFEFVDENTWVNRRMNYRKKALRHLWTVCKWSINWDDYQAGSWLKFIEKHGLVVSHSFQFVKKLDILKSKMNSGLSRRYTCFLFS